MATRLVSMVCALLEMAQDALLPPQLLPPIQLGPLALLLLRQRQPPPVYLKAVAVLDRVRNVAKTLNAQLQIPRNASPKYDLSLG